MIDTTKCKLTCPGGSEKGTCDCLAPNDCKMVWADAIAKKLSEELIPKPYSPHPNFIEVRIATALETVSKRLSYETTIERVLIELADEILDPMPINGGSEWEEWCVRSRERTAKRK